jgi:hypothetical protein
MLFFSSKILENHPVLCNGLPQMIDATFANCTAGSRKYLPTEDGLPPLGNALVWAWDTTKMVVNTDLVDHKRFSFRIEHDARLGRKFILLDALYGSAQ